MILDVRRVWVKWLLPGIEEFLINTLASESLTSFAEERRQFFVERLDIANLPPSVPPREGRVLPQELLKETEESSGIPADHSAPDFAATQREISRSFIDHNTEIDVSSLEKEVKVYDDIDEPDRTTSENSQQITIDTNNNDDSDDNENALYEVPVSKQIPVDDNSVSCGTDGSSLATTASTEELSHESLDSTTTPSLTGVAPPLPARKDRSLSEPQSRSFAYDEEEKPPDLPYRPPLPKRNEIYTLSDKSDRSETEKSLTSEPDLSGDGDSTSYESFDEDNDPPSTDIASRYDVKLPKKPKQKTTIRRNGKLRKSKSPVPWEIDVPFQKLDSIHISGELFDKGKLKWNRRIVAISNGHMVVYKPEKDAKPSLVIPLAGYEANIYEREGKKGFEVRMTKTEGDSFSFCVQLKEWAQIWTEHINGHAKGQPPPKYHTHLAGSLCECADFYINPPTFGSKKVTRMGSFAFRATQFLENIGKKTSGRRKSPHPASCRHSCGDTTDASRKPFHILVSSSSSLGNLARGSVSPTSDNSMNSVFGDTSASSQPTTPCDTSEAGHVSVFSNFNKRCWGKRWCLVKGNMFECYLNELSHQCELTFPLKTCLLRRAVSEINSENGLMLVEGNKERITIEPLSVHEMVQWVRVLLRETSTEGVPEGLERFLQEDTGELLGPAFQSFYLYIQDRDKTVCSHEYEDPEETMAVVAQLKASCETPQGLDVQNKADMNANIVRASDLVKVTDSLMLTCKYNQTTDSGFYSVVDAASASDSDSSCGNSAVHNKSEEGYSTIDSSQLHSSSSSQPTLQSSSSSSSHRFSPSQPSTPLLHSKKHSSSAKSQHQTNQPPNSADTDSNTISCVGQSEITVSTQPNSIPASIVTKSGSSRRTSQTILSPSGEEYSIILKRSERTSVSQISSVDLSNGCQSKAVEKHYAAKHPASDKNTHVGNSIEANKFPSVDRLTQSLNCDLMKPTVKTIATVKPTKEQHSEGQISTITKLQHPYDSFEDQPPPLPRSPVPSFHRQIPTFSKSIPTTPQTVEVLTITPCQSGSPNTVVCTPNNNKGHVSIPDLQELIRKPNTTVEEIGSAIDSFKTKQVELKRKKMAVHDKRQRVLSDEERLACEKEFAALEKLGESTERTIRTLQVLCSLFCFVSCPAFLSCSTCLILFIKYMFDSVYLSLPCTVYPVLL
ncbi:unnamed protein product [Candidula unifasciata]|uniref:PH domain-containing protein n=1 Tax=Candidula unifasciata TaxID=100452 RepID=A0A8S3Z526_9EUPU|nr:unnamed protein product [Candidula unifasciata]